MTKLGLNIKISDMDDTHPEDAVVVCESFIKCVGILLGTFGTITQSENYMFAEFTNIPDDKAQAMEEVIGQTLWNVQLGEG